MEEIPEFVKKAMLAQGKMSEDELRHRLDESPVEAAGLTIQEAAAAQEHVEAHGEPEQITLDIDAGRAARDQGIARAGAGAEPDWKYEAKAALDALIEEGNPFTADDVWTRVGFKPHEPRALGALFQQASKAGRIVQTGARQPSARPEHHAYPMTVWRPT